MVITGLSITNFKSLAQIPSTRSELVPFGPLNVLIGPNGCGKSSLLQAIDFLRAFFRTSAEVYLHERSWHYRDLPNLRQVRKTIRWELKAQLGPDVHGNFAGEYHYVVELQPRKHLGIGEERLSWTSSGGQAVELLRRKGRKCLLLRSGSQKVNRLEQFAFIGLPASVMSLMDPQRDRGFFPEALHFRAWIEGFRSYLIWDPKVLRMPARGKHGEIGPSGEHLPSVIGHLKDTNRPAFDKLVRRLKRLFPTLTDISVSGGGWGWRTIRLHERNGGSVVYNSQQMSDGVLRLLAVVSMLYIDRIPSLITFEEPENGVHPQLIREVVQILRELTQRKAPNQCQVFLTTHSPYVLDEFYDNPEQVYCMDRTQPRSGTTIKRLSDLQQVKIVRDAFEQSLGEAWTSGILGSTAGVTN